MNDAFQCYWSGNSKHQLLEDKLAGKHSTKRAFKRYLKAADMYYLLWNNDLRYYLDDVGIKKVMEVMGVDLRPYLKKDEDGRYVFVPKEKIYIDFERKMDEYVIAASR